MRSARPQAASGPVTRFGRDLRILLHLLCGQPKSGDQRTRLQAFYGPQAGHYDVFRDRLLHGRERLIDDLHAALLHARQDALGDAHVIELGGGNGRNLEFFCARLDAFGQVALVAFYVSAAKPPDGQIRHGALTRWFWPRWFAHDGVHPNPEHLAALRARFPAHQFSEERAPVPYLPGFSVPYYRFLGRLG
ncbi:hypothetical protein [Thiorhodovibrio frisius]|uniref:S-adenosyl-L-methionine-dependent methyltransferase n=1 Tax=Thiorhodovibrio frisius TaxID=631362 RepID=H8Z382_9GAMM|nr:hypothetical protein [Thiorhodovibrio frisius]EIC21790.1 hypothetical protein Thi970DRAFT_02021 [Thiorhodovibrio frisius]WPL21758.1 S-adenosylmethionine:diacylglycerol 3-amino-3-carboxypropyl transferase [Thiorhodovibrio frisius]